MNQSAERVFNGVTSRIGHYKALNQLMDLEQKYLIDLDLENLKETARAKEKTIGRIKTQAEPLAASIKELGQTLGIKGETLPTLAELSQTLDEPYSIKLRQAGRELAQIRSEVNIHNLDNKNFVQDVLDLMQDSLAVLTGTLPSSADNYQPDGGQTVSKPIKPAKLNREI